jgi:cytochrome c oxidase subunit 2
MGTAAKAIAVTYSIVVIVGLVLAYGIARSTRADRKPLDAEKAAEREKGWLGMVVAFLVVTLLGTMLLIPYGESAGGDKQVVTVVAQQFGFVISPPKVKVGAPVEFHLTSKDTSHGFGLMTKDNTLLVQAQIAPEHEQVVDYTFKSPGSYQVVCFEFCGVGHHTMLARIEVTQ